MRLIDADTLKYKNLAEVNGRLTYVLTAEEIDNAPTVEYPFYQEAYQTGYEEGKKENRLIIKAYRSGYENCKKDVIHSIAKQYSEHNELVPSWLHIGNMRGKDNE